MTMTYHCEVTRANRIQHIVDEIGIGQVVKEGFLLDRNTGKGKYICLTDTGIIIVKDELKQKVITMYVATTSEVVRLYAGRHRVPKYLLKKVDRNQSKFTNNGKTIWK